MVKKLQVFFAALIVACLAVGLCLFVACDENKSDTDNKDNKPQSVAVESVTLNKSELTLIVGAEETLTVTVAPNNATDKNVSWTSSADNVATVNGGKVTAVSAGTAKITASAGGKSAICTVTVNNKSGETDIAVESVTLNKSKVTLEIGSSETLTATVSPDNATNKEVRWSSSLESVATVYNGKITARSAGTTTVTATAGGKSASCTVTVNSNGSGGQTIAVESVTLDRNSLILEVGNKYSLSATVAPENANDKTVSWSSSASSIVRVNDDGEVLAVSVGTANITATAGGKSAVCSVTVNKPFVAVEEVTINKNTLTLEIDGEETLIASVTPNDATNKKVTWSSSNTSVATVTDSSGKVKAVAAGTATITATAGDKSATCVVTVNSRQIPIESISLEDYQTTFTHNETYLIGYSIEPYEASEAEVKWSSSDTDIVTVDSEGNITTKAAGIATITATAGGKSAKLTITVTGFKYRHNLDDDTYTVIKGSIITDEEYEAAEGVFIPATTWNGGVVRDIDSNAFADDKKLITVVLPYSLKSVGSYAFKGCSNLDTVCTYYEREMGENSDGISIGNYAFNGCSNLYEVYDGEEVIKKVGTEAFKGCSQLKIIYLPVVQSIGTGAFEGCTDIDEIDNAYLCLESIGENAFKGCTSLTCFTVDTRFMGEYVLKSIGKSAFEGCVKLEEFTVPISLESIGERAFMNCSALGSVNIDIEGLSALYNLNSIGKNAFYGCAELAEIVLPAKVTVIADNLFKGCTKLSSVTIKGNATSIGEEAFSDCSALQTIELPETLKTIKRAAFIQSGLTEISIPESVTTIGSTAFNSCLSLTRVEIFGLIKRIENATFASCRNLEEVILPDTIESINDSAFRYNSYLEKIIYGGTADQWKSITKADGWDANAGEYTVDCSDGTKLNKNGVEI